MTQVQNNVFQFNFEKTYKEIDVAGKLYKVAFDDDSMLRYQVSFKDYEAKVQEAQQIAPDYEKASIDEIKAVAEKQKELMKDAIEIFLGDDTFNELYEKAGRSSINLIGLIDYMMNLVKEELESRTGEVNSKYLANIKK
ncbi:hypothetical protein OCD65_27935 [Bacillus paranthracis]|uniref:hypothetical protein n=1 Tax=Bacillus cereus group TaxID=86661 RepID=UPI001F568D38|nr:MULTISPECIES: hypothetical protein [Bacillus cereus group]MCU5020513.1 hypothetical protein [Bacillus paranthracis]